MTSYDELQLETEKYIDQLEEVLDFSDFLILRNNHMINIYGSLKKSIGEFVSQDSLVEKINNLETKGTFGKQIELFKETLSVVDRCMRGYLFYGQEISENIVPRLHEITSEQRTTASDIRHKVHTGKHTEATKIASVSAAHSKVIGIQQKMIASKEKVGTISTTLLGQYCSAASEYKEAVTDLNQFHNEFIETLENLTEIMKGKLMTREAHLKSFMLSSYPVIKESVQHCQLLQSYTSDFTNTWSRDFLDAMESTGVVRTSPVREEFKQWTFSFDDQMLNKAILRPQRSNVVIPVSFAEATRQFDGENDNELSVKVGDRLYIYEQLQADKWVFAETADKRRGYVPSAVLKDLGNGCDTVFTAAPRLGDSPFPTGSLFIVKERTSDCVLCENIAGEEIKV